MIIDKDSIQVNGVKLAQYLVDAKFGYHKIWSDDTGRNLAGSMVGTLMGTFPKVTVTFRKLTRAEIELLAPILDSPRQSFTSYDPTLHRAVTRDTYTGDWEYNTHNTFSNIAKPLEQFTIAFINIHKRVGA